MSENRKQEEEGLSLFAKIAIGVGAGIGALALLGYMLQDWITTTDHLFHYTTLEGARSILRSRCIRVSSGGGDARFGNGVYMTSLHPKAGHESILKNNYDGARVSTRRSDNANYYFRFNKSDLPRARKQDSERDIWLCPHEILLDCVDYTCSHIDANVELNHDKRTGALTQVNFSE